jgi:hypothetical protein
MTSTPEHRVTIRVAGQRDADAKSSNRGGLPVEAGRAVVLA